MFGQDRMQMAC